MLNQKPNLVQTLPLTDIDRKALAQRAGLVWQIMKYLYLALAIGLGLYTFKMAFIHHASMLKNMKEGLVFAMAIGSIFLACHLLLAVWEKKLFTTINAELQQGIKLCRTGILESIEEGQENQPTRLRLRITEPHGLEEFSLHTIADLSRISPSALLGKPVVIEYSPISRIVLQLRLQDHAV